MIAIESKYRLKLSGGFPSIKLTLSWLMQVFGRQAKLIDVLRTLKKY
jgi:hypothetical protein|tara:strand:- start:576 stop:716 length:141 start_codon:yes stop_codon:yes gene_type:complete